MTQHTKTEIATTEQRRLRLGSTLMAVSGLAFVGYGVVFFIWNFAGSGFELGVDTLNGITRSELTAMEPAVTHYISHLHVATAAFIISTGLAVAGLSWKGVATGQMWAWVTAVSAAVVGLALALPMHWLDLFGYGWVTHLGPIYLVTVVFVIGALWALDAIRSGSTTT